jgi:Domain of unknown function (DUF4190)
VTHGGDPFQQQPADPFGAPTGPPTISYPHPSAELWQFGPGYQSPRPQSPPYNTFAVLSPILAILVPPAGVVLGHLALPQIRRTGERGWLAAIWGLVLGYLMCVALLAAAIWFAWSSHTRSTPAAATPTSAPSAATPSTSVVTSIAPPSTTPRIKLDLTQATVGTCVEVQIRGGGGEDALDLFKVPCAHRDGVYTVVARVANDSDCNTTYVAAPPDHTFAVCLNRY